MRYLAIGIFLTVGLAAGPVSAKIDRATRTRIEATFQPAVEHPGLRNHQELLLPGNLRGFVTLVQGGIPAEKSEFFITNNVYEYRPVVVDVKSGSTTTRRGKAYTYLDRGMVMIISGVKYFGNTVYLELLSSNIYAKHTLKEKHPSRVAVMLGFKLPAATVAAGSDAVIAELSKWVQPFRDRGNAEEFAEELRGSKAPQGHL